MYLIIPNTAPTLLQAIQEQIKNCTIANITENLDIEAIKQSCKVI